MLGPTLCCPVKIWVSSRFRIVRPVKTTKLSSSSPRLHPITVPTLLRAHRRGAHAWTSFIRTANASPLTSRQASVEIIAWWRPWCSLTAAHTRRLPTSDVGGGWRPTAAEAPATTDGGGESPVAAHIAAHEPGPRQRAPIPRCAAGPKRGLPRLPLLAPRRVRHAPQHPHRALPGWAASASPPRAAAVSSPRCASSATIHPDPPPATTSPPIPLTRSSRHSRLHVLYRDNGSKYSERRETTGDKKVN
jgi:hypothetical protein